MEEEKKPDWLIELEQKAPKALIQLLNERDCAALLSKELPRYYSPQMISVANEHQRVWELFGLFFQNQSRYFEALAIFSALYDHLLLAQENTDQHIHKGMPLVFMSDCYRYLGFPVLGKRHIMLTLCEDAIHCMGNVPPNTSGTYFRLVWQWGLSDLEFKRYAELIYKKWQENPNECKFPEWILQQLDQNWMAEFVSTLEAGIYTANTRYIQHLLSQLGHTKGKGLEEIAEYILSCMPGCRTALRKRSNSTDYDVVCSIEGFEVDFRSELGRYFVCECKDWKIKANFSTIAKFCRVLDSTKSRFGILFSKMGITGKGRTKYAEREQLKVFQDRGMVIVVVDQEDLNFVAQGGNFTTLLRSKYEKVRLDLA